MAVVYMATVIASQIAFAATTDHAEGMQLGVALPMDQQMSAITTTAPEIKVAFLSDDVPPFSDTFSRLGSRLPLILKFDNKNGGIRTSTHGMPEAAMRKLICGIRLGDTTTLLPLCGQAPEGSKLTTITHQRMTMQSTKYFTSSGFTVTITAPFSRSKSLDDSFDVRCQIAPVYLVTLEIANNGKTPQKGSFVFGLDRPLTSIFGNKWAGIVCEDIRQDADLAKSVGAVPWLKSIQFNSEDPESKTLAITTNATELTLYDTQSRQFPGSGVITVPFNVKPGNTVVRTFVISGHNNKPYISDKRTNKPLYLYYNRVWPSHQLLLDWTHGNLSKLTRTTQQFDRSLALAKVRPAQRFVTVLGCRGYLENSVLTWDGKDDVYYCSYEAGFSGGYNNTLDLVPDTMVWDLNCHPWTIQNVIRRFKEYTWQDKYGIFMMHDMGAHDFCQSEQYVKDGGPYMVGEQAANFIHTTYALWKFGANKSWLKENQQMLEQLLDSLLARDSNGDGLYDLLTNLGRDGNTVDDGSDMGNAKNNHYMGIKHWVAFRACAEMFEALGDKQTAATANTQAAKLKQTLVEHVKKNGFFWHNASSECSPNPNLVKGLFTAYLTGMDLSDAQDLVAAVRQHLDNTVTPTACFYGYPISLTEAKTWNSQTMMVAAMAEKFLGGPEMYAAERIANAFYYTGIANEFYSVKDPNETMGWPKDQHYSRMSAAMSWLPGTMRSERNSK